jgi:hypothetical protein
VSVVLNGGLVPVASHNVTLLTQTFAIS